MFYKNKVCYGRLTLKNKIGYRKVMKMKKGNQANALNGKDLINIGIFTAIFVVLNVAVACTLGMIPIGFMLLAFVTPIVTGIPIMLYYTRIKKFGMILIMEIILGLVLLLTGMGYNGLILGIAFGLLGELIFKIGNYTSSKMAVLSYAVVSVAISANYIHWLSASKEWLSKKAISYGEVYINSVSGFFDYNWIFPVLMLSAFVGGIIGALIGKSTLKKHFERSGLL